MSNLITIVKYIQGFYMNLGLIIKYTLMENQFEPMIRILATEKV